MIFKAINTKVCVYIYIYIYICCFTINVLLAHPSVKCVEYSSIKCGWCYFICSSFLKPRIQGHIGL